VWGQDTRPILTAPIRLHGYNFLIEQALNKALEFFKELKHFRFMTEEDKGM
jgi:hypothetical protein